MQELDNRLLHVYITDALKVIAENASKSVVPGIGVVDVGSTLTKRWIDMTKPQKPEPKEPEDTRTCREITDGIWQRMRGGK